MGEQRGSTSNEGEDLLRHPFYDPLFLWVSASMFFAFVAIHAWDFVLPVILLSPSFGITSSMLSTMVGLALGTLSLNILVGAVISKRIMLLLGAVPGIMCGGSVSGLSYALWGA